MSDSKPVSPYCPRHHRMVLRGIVTVEDVRSAPEGECPLCAAISEPVKGLLPEGSTMDPRMFEGVLYAFLGRLTGSPTVQRMGMETMSEAVHAEVMRKLASGEIDPTKAEPERGVVEINDELDDELDSKMDVEVIDDSPE